jgi:hypothetical protein
MFASIASPLAGLYVEACGKSAFTPEPDAANRSYLPFFWVQSSLADGILFR